MRFVSHALAIVTLASTVVGSWLETQPAPCMELHKHVWRLAKASAWHTIIRSTGMTTCFEFFAFTTRITLIFVMMGLLDSQRFHVLWCHLIHDGII